MSKVESGAAAPDADVRSEDLAHVRALTRSYLRGDSHDGRLHRELIEKFLGVVEIALWVFPDITVKSGSVLSFGAGTHVLLARNLTVEHGAWSARTALTVDCTQLLKERRFKFVDIVEHALHIADLSRWAISAPPCA